MVYAKRFQRTGECQRCGSCCRGEITADLTSDRDLAPGVRPSTSEEVVVALHEIGFVVLTLQEFVKEGSDVVRWKVMMRCRNLDEAGLCKNYEKRPDLCRGYPNHFNTHHQGCGYLWKEVAWGMLGAKTS